MKLFLKILGIFVLISVGYAVYLSYSYNKFVNSVPDDKNAKRVIDIKHGESASSVISRLEKEGVITSSRKFYYFGRLQGKLDEIKYGEYEFTTSMRPFEILNKLISGDVKKYKVTIPEGYNLYQIADVLSYVLAINQDELMNKSLDATYVKSLGIDAPSLEGYLFPDTYYFTKDSKLDSIIRKMVATYKRYFTEKMRARARTLKMTEHEIVTLASIIEKETANVDEMPLISSVFHNRLKKGMRLQSDPTTIYGIADFNGNLTKKDLVTFTPYNTYKIKGLPPTPIASPGKTALKAALFPENSSYLYFVSKNNGSHQFSENIDDHNKAVFKYQIKREKAED
jgi:UPF0755 protein